MKMARMMKKGVAIGVVMAMFITTAFAMESEFSGVTEKALSNQDQTFDNWTLDMDDDQSTLSTTAGVEAGSRTALVIKTGDNLGEAANTAAGEWNGSATAIGWWTDYGAHGGNGGPMYYEYDFSFTAGTSFHIRGFETANANGTSGSFQQALAIENNNLIVNNGTSGSDWENTGYVAPNVIHTLRVEVSTPSSGSGDYYTKYYLDGALRYTEDHGEAPAGTNFLITTANSEARVYRIARMVASTTAEKRNYCKTFDGKTLDTLHSEYFTAENLDGWYFYENGHQLSIEAEDTNTNYLKLIRTGPGGNGHMRYNVSTSEALPKDLNVTFSYWGMGLNQFRFLDSTGAQFMCMLNLVDNQLVWGTDSSDYSKGKVIKAFVAPYVEHELTISLKQNMLAIFLDGEFLHLTEPLFSDFSGMPAQLRFYNMAQKFNTMQWGHANRNMYAGLNIKEISTDDDLLIDSGAANSVELTIMKDGVAVDAVYPDNTESVISGKAKILNLSDDAVAGKLILARYRNNILDELIAGNEFSVPAGGNVETDAISFSAGNTQIGTSYKLFAWKSTGSLHPLGKSVEVGSPVEALETIELASHVDTESWNVQRIADTIKKANRGESIVVAALGGSITEGAGVADKSNSYANRVADWWEEKYPGQVTRVNAGVGGTDSFLGVHRMPGQVLAKAPDFTVVDFAVNDNDYDFQDYAYETILRDILESGDTASVMMAFFMNVSSGRATNAQNMERPIGRHYSVPMVSIADAIQKQVDANTIKWDDVMDDIVHPNEVGHWIAAECITSVLDSVYDTIKDGTYEDTTYAVPAATYMSDKKFTDAVIYVGDNADGVKSGQLITPAYEAGTWTTGYAIDYCPSWTNNYGTGWSTTQFNKPITFQVSGKYISLIYRGYDNASSGVVRVDIDEEEPYYIDSKEGSYVHVIHDAYIKDAVKNDGITLEALTEGAHTVTVTLLAPADYPSSITAGNRTGDFFGLCGIAASN